MLPRTKDEDWLPYIDTYVNETDFAREMQEHIIVDMISAWHNYCSRTIESAKHEESMAASVC